MTNATTLETSTLVVLLVLACAPTSTSLAIATPEPTPTPTPIAAPTPAPTEAPAKPIAPVSVRDTASDTKWHAIAANFSIERRVVIGRYAGVRYEPEGEVVLDGGGAIAFELAPVVDVQGDRIQIIANAQTSTAGVLLWIDVHDVAPQLMRPVVLHDHETRKLEAGDGTFELAPGELVEVLETKGDAARVRTRYGDFTGWVDADALGPTWKPMPFERPPFDAEIRPSTTVHTRPGGAALHKLSPMANGRHNAHVVAKQPGWLQIELVEPCRPTIRVRGFVRSKTTEITGVQARGFGCGRAGGLMPTKWGELKDAPPVRVPADTELLTAEGELVGRLRSEGELRRGSDGVLRLATAWGLLPVHVKS